jgi:hypothetical protein
MDWGSVESAPDPPANIRYAQAPQLAVSVSTDPDLVERIPHELALQQLMAGVGWNYADTRAGTLQLLKTTHAHLIYFYCHGGVQNDIIFILVGHQEKGISRGNIRVKKIRWEEPRPVVFINGCHTTAVRPEMALDFVSALSRTRRRAAGVIGTEITIFEHLARRFAEIAWLDSWTVRPSDKRSGAVGWPYLRRRILSASCTSRLESLAFTSNARTRAGALTRPPGGFARSTTKGS